jgi:hypothetical protein
MHMIFYTNDVFAEMCYVFWDDHATVEERAAWVDFLRDLQYNVEDRELVVNELQVRLGLGFRV